MRKFDNFASALDVLSRAGEEDLANEFVQGGVIAKFALQFELSWKLLKELLAYEGDPVSATGSPREVVKAAYRYYDSIDEDLWLSMLRDRNSVARVYDSERASRLVDTIIERYVPAFERLRAEVADRYPQLTGSDEGGGAPADNSPLVADGKLVAVGATKDRRYVAPEA